jgi:CRP/FNR family cyclic AMP-dependent transcriptional regulator
MPRNNEYLAKIPMFQACSKRELATIARAATVIDVEEGKRLTVEGAIGKEFFLILEGKADVKRNGRSVASLGPGEFFGELALLDNSRRDATVTAKTPMEVLVVNQREFNSLLEQSPALTRKLLVGMARRLHDLDGGA